MICIKVLAAGSYIRNSAQPPFVIPVRANMCPTSNTRNGRGAADQMRESEILFANSEGIMDVEQPQNDRARPQLSGIGSPTLVARLDVVADHAGHLFRLQSSVATATPSVALPVHVPWAGFVGEIVPVVP